MIYWETCGFTEILNWTLDSSPMSLFYRILRNQGLRENREVEVKEQQNKIYGCDWDISTAIKAKKCTYYNITVSRYNSLLCVATFLS